MWPNQRPNFSRGRGLPPPPRARFTQMSHEPRHLMKYMNPYDFNYRTPPIMNTFHLPHPAPNRGRGGSQMNVLNTRKRKPDEIPHQNATFFGAKKRPRMDLAVQNRRPVANPATLNQKASKKKKNKKKREQNPILVQMKSSLYHELIDFITTSKLFTTPLPLDEEKVESDSEAIQLPVLEGFPWAKFEKYPVLVGENPAIKIDEEMKHAVKSVALPESTYTSTLKRVIDDLNASVQIEGCTNDWSCFGSYLYGLVSKESDIDLFYECKPIHDGSNPVYTTAAVTQKIKKILFKSERFRSVTCIKKARVPLVRAIHYGTRKQLDISFSTKLGVRNSLLTKLYLNLSPNLKYLTLYLKETLKMYETLGQGRITTHILFWLIAFFMQHKKLLPAVIDVRKAATIKYVEGGWDCSLPEDYSYPTEPVSLYSLLLEFFIFYRDFDFLNYVICPFLGRVFLLSDFERLRIPKEEFSVYLQQLQNPKQTMFSRGAINLQDPSDLSFNLAKQVEAAFVNRFKIICFHLSYSLPSTTCDLHEVLSLNEYIPKRINFDEYEADNLTQYWMFVLNTNTITPQFAGKLNYTSMLEAIRKLMEVVFEFEKKRIVVDENHSYVYFSNGETHNATSSVIYFEYCSTQNTWMNYFIKKIIPQNECEQLSGQQPLRVYLTCEVSLDKKLVRIFVQSEMHFIEFLRENLIDLFKFALEKMVPS